MHRTQFRNASAERLAELVTARLGRSLDHGLFVGSDASDLLGALEQERVLARVTERGRWLAERLRSTLVSLRALVPS